MVFGKKVAIFYWECGQTLALREGQKMPCYGCGYSLGESLDLNEYHNKYLLFCVCSFSEVS